MQSSRQLPFAEQRCSSRDGSLATDRCGPSSLLAMSAFDPFPHLDVSMLDAGVAGPHKRPLRSHALLHHKRYVLSPLTPSCIGAGIAFQDVFGLCTPSLSGAGVVLQPSVWSCITHLLVKLLASTFVSCEFSQGRRLTPWGSWKSGLNMLFRSDRFQNFLCTMMNVLCLQNQRD